MVVRIMLVAIFQCLSTWKTDHVTRKQLRWRFVQVDFQGSPSYTSRLAKHGRALNTGYYQNIISLFHIWIQPEYSLFWSYLKSPGYNIKVDLYISFSDTCRRRPILKSGVFRLKLALCFALWHLPSVSHAFHTDGNPPPGSNSFF